MSLSRIEKIVDAYNRIKDYIHETPVMSSRIIDSMVGRKVFFKCENLQKTGSFKIRGALNNILCKMESKEVIGVVTHSSGNHGQAVAYAAKLLNIPAIIVVPEDTPQVKCDAIRQYGAEIQFCQPSPISRIETCEKLSAERKYDIIHPFDDYETIDGQGTLGLEFLKQAPVLNAVLISTSGGGLSAGCAIALKSVDPDIKVYCVEPVGKELAKSLRSGSRLWEQKLKYLDTKAEGIKTMQPGKLTFPILCELAEKEVFTMEDMEMIQGMKLSMKYLKQVIEMASGACVQALLKYNDIIPKDCKHIGIILCGGNCDIESMFKN